MRYTMDVDGLAMASFQDRSHLQRPVHQCRLSKILGQGELAGFGDFDWFFNYAAPSGWNGDGACRPVTGNGLQDNICWIVRKDFQYHLNKEQSGSIQSFDLLNTGPSMAGVQSGQLPTQVLAE